MTKLFRWICDFLNPIASRLRQQANAGLPTVGSSSPVSQVPLAQQLETLAQLGLRLNDGVTAEDLLGGWDRHQFENHYDFLLDVLGTEIQSEPWGRNICDRVWNFDLECIEDTGAYVKIVYRRRRRMADINPARQNSPIEDGSGITPKLSW